MNDWTNDTHIRIKTNFSWRMKIRSLKFSLVVLTGFLELYFFKPQRSVFLLKHHSVDFPHVHASFEISHVQLISKKDHLDTVWLIPSVLHEIFRTAVSTVKSAVLWEWESSANQWYWPSRALNITEQFNCQDKVYQSNSISERVSQMHCVLCSEKQPYYCVQSDHTMRSQRVHPWFFLQVGNTVLIVFVSYFGSRVHRPRCIGIGAIIASMASFLFALPHFISGKYQYTDDINSKYFYFPQ